MYNFCCQKVQVAKRNTNGSASVSNVVATIEADARLKWALKRVKPLLMEL
jgi:hypothetical protein